GCDSYLAGQVQYQFRIQLSNDLRHIGDVPYIEILEIDRAAGHQPLQILSSPSTTQIVDNNHFPSAFGEVPRTVGTDKSGSTCYNYRFSHVIISKQMFSPTIVSRSLLAADRAIDFS